MRSTVFVGHADIDGFPLSVEIVKFSGGDYIGYVLSGTTRLATTQVCTTVTECFHTLYYLAEKEIWNHPLQEYDDILAHLML